MPGWDHRIDQPGTAPKRREETLFVESDPVGLPGGILQKHSSHQRVALLVVDQFRSTIQQILKGSQVGSVLGLADVEADAYWKSLGPSLDDV